MSTWKEFYQNIKDPSWPECDREQDFDQLPDHIQKECKQTFGYTPRHFEKISKHTNRRFPIQTETACQLKWNWSTVFLTQENTASCHRTNAHKFDTEKFDFHNTPTKIEDRQRMLKGQWPKNGCNYCRSIEAAGGQSDRITNLDFPGIHAPIELDTSSTATVVTPRILEIYFDNTCDLKCLYCGPHFSSLWDAENRKHGVFHHQGVTLAPFTKSANIESNKQKLFDWIRLNSQHLTVFNILGGEPLYQDETNQCLDLFEQYPAPELKLQIFTNLNAKLERVKRLVDRVKKLVDSNKLREFEITASLDCWGEAQEYVRYPLDLKVWQNNFEYLVKQSWINLIVSSTVTPLTIKTLPELIEKINTWQQDRPIYHYQNSVNSPSYMFIDIFGDIFRSDFDRAIALKPAVSAEQQSSRRYLEGIAQQSSHGGPNHKEIQNLFYFLNEIDRRRGTSWPKTFPWLIEEFAKHSLKI